MALVDQFNEVRQDRPTIAQSAELANVSEAELETLINEALNATADEASLSGGDALFPGIPSPADMATVVGQVVAALSK
jgi:hypothetical protein